MDFKVIWTETAISDLQEICGYIGANDRAAAERIGRGILGHVKILESFPLIGPPYPRRSNGAIREIVFRNYRIFYEVCGKPKSVHVLRVWHGARSEPDL